MSTLSIRTKSETLIHLREASGHGFGAMADPDSIVIDGMWMRGEDSIQIAIYLTPEEAQRLIEQLQEAIVTTPVSVACACPECVSRRTRKMHHP